MSAIHSFKFIGSRLTRGTAVDNNAAKICIVESEDLYAKTALHDTVSIGHEKPLRLPIEKGADANLNNQWDEIAVQSLGNSELLCRTREWYIE
jgi:hypothetical protein